MQRLTYLGLIISTNNRPIIHMLVQVHMQVGFLPMAHMLNPLLPPVPWGVMSWHEITPNLHNMSSSLPQLSMEIIFMFQIRFRLEGFSKVHLTFVEGH